MDIFNWLPDRKLNNLDQAYPSSMDNLRTATNDPAKFWLGMLGKCFEYKQADALRLSNTSVGTLYGAKFQVVRFKSTSTIAPTKGFVCGWSDRDNYIVTPDAVDRNNFAGVLIKTQTKGNIGVIVVAGEVEAQYGVLTKNPNVAGDLVLLVTATAKVDTLANITAVTWGSLQPLIAVAVEAAASNELKRIRLLNDSHAQKKGII